MELYLLGKKINVITSTADIHKVIIYEREFFMHKQPFNSELTITDSDFEKYKGLCHIDNWLYEAWGNNFVAVLQDKLGGEFLFLHGSCIETASKATAFLGSSMSGKTTLTLTALQLGCKMLTDDVVAIKLDDFTVYPFIKPMIVRGWISPYVKTYLPDINKFFKPFKVKGTQIEIPDQGAYFSTINQRQFTASPTKLKSVYYLRNKDNESLQKKLISIIPSSTPDTTMILKSIFSFMNQITIKSLTPPSLMNFQETELFEVIKNYIAL
ncbi:MAG: hypothetical protein HY606_09015 [Planctomycetes bacterium]|nr:hypothetical protein [Planctomycetota bacterium]